MRFHPCLVSILCADPSLLESISVEKLSPWLSCHFINNQFGQVALSGDSNRYLINDNLWDSVLYFHPYVAIAFKSLQVISPDFI